MLPSEHAESPDPERKGPTDAAPDRDPPPLPFTPGPARGRLAQLARPQSRRHLARDRAAEVVAGERAAGALEERPARRLLCRGRGPGTTLHYGQGAKGGNRPLPRRQN